MVTYVFRYRRLGQWFWRKKRVAGHSLSRTEQGNILDPEKMVLYFEDGSIQEICCWSKCEAKLGPDFFAKRHAEIEKSAGQAIPVAVRPSDARRQ